MDLENLAGLYKMYTNVTTMKMPSNHLNNDFVKLTGQSLKNAKIPTKHINIFETFILVYDNFFPKVKAQIKTKSLHSPWLTKGIAKSSKRK